MYVCMFNEFYYSVHTICIFPTYRMGCIYKINERKVQQTKMLFYHHLLFPTNKINCEGENVKVNYMEWVVSKLLNKNEC